MASSSTVSEAPAYRPKDAIASSVNTTLLMGGGGVFASAVQNTLQKQNVGAMGILTRTGGTIAMFATMGGAYQFIKDSTANLREKEDHWNTIWGGFAAGAVVGIRARTFPSLLGYGVLVATTLGTFDYAGGSFGGQSEDRDVDEFERREAMRKNYRSPGWETIAELGEGRGIKAPGYAERRRERIKQNYGIDVPVEQPSASA